VNKAGRIGTRRLSSQSVLDILGRRGREAGLPDFAPHDLRRTAITRLLAAGVDLHTVSRFAGHANVQTTARYDKRGEEAKKRAAGLLGL
jgi:integrase